MKKTISIIMVLMLFTLVLTGCTRKRGLLDDDDVPEQTENADTVDDLDNSIKNADSIDEELNQEELDSKVQTLEQDIEEW